MILVTWNLLLWIGFFEVLPPETLAYFPCIALLGCLQKSILTVARYRIYRTGNDVFINVVKLFGAHAINRRLPECVGDKNPRKHREEFYCVLCGISSLCLHFVPLQGCFAFFFSISISTRKIPGRSKQPSQEVSFNAEPQPDWRSKTTHLSWQWHISSLLHIAL